MIHLSVEIDSTLLRLLHDNRDKKKIWQENFEAYCLQNNIQLPKDSFTDFPETITEKELSCMFEQVEYLESRKGESIRHIRRYFPDTSNDLHHHLKVVLLPYGKINYGPREGIQLYSLFPDANPVETYLFLIHVFYHEISFLNYTERCQQVSENHKTIENYQCLLQLLIQNEGIGNFAVLEDLEHLIQTVDVGYHYRYFTYAEKLKSTDLIIKCMDVINQIFILSEENFQKYYKQINGLIKSIELPAINLVGLHMATCIVKKFGEDKLRNVHKIEPSHFFTLYFQTDDDLIIHFPNIRDRVLN